MGSQKRFKRTFTLLESFPNELFLDIFSYLSGVDAVFAFSRLNNRFQCLTLNYSNTFDFKLVSKKKFDYVIRQHDMHRWRSLRLSDDDKTPGQVTYFCQSFSLNENISQLQTLSILNTKSDTALLFLRQLTLFTHLVSLSIGFICGQTVPLVELCSLKHLVINSCTHTNWMMKLQLKSLQHTIEHHCTHEHNLTWPTTLKQLKVFITQSGDNEIVRASLSHLSQLSSLSVHDSAWESPPPDGRIWEELISSSLPLLKNFEFCFKFWRDVSLASDTDQILSTFATPFYLQDKSWFVQCDAHHQQFSIAVLYSLPFAFEHFEIVTHSFDESISTKNLKKNLYENVNTLMVDITCETMNEALITKNIIDLSLKHAGKPAVWIFSMTGIYQLTLGHQINISTEEFIRLLKCNRHLKSLIVSYHTLKLLTNKWENKKVCELLSRKIRSLKISSSDCSPVNMYDYVKVDDLLHIVQVFSRSCQHLNVTVYSRNIVAGLILRTMGQLRSLKVRLKEHNDDLKITREWLIKQNAMYENLDCSIVADENEYSFWMSRRR